MAGLYIILGDSSRERIESAAGRLKFFEETVQVIHTPGFAAAWVGHDDPELFTPAFDPQTGVYLLTAGRVSWDEPDWKRAESLAHYSGGLSNRLLLERYLERGPAALDRHNGPAALVVWDPRAQIVHLWTDHFGYHPVFLFQPEKVDGAVIATFAETIAGDPEIQVTRDPVALAEFLSAWRVTPPHTYYREIQYAGAATHWTWDLARHNHARREYWQPYQEAPFPDVNAAAEELASAVSEAVRIRTLPRLGPIVCYTSGGMDSRTVLFSAASPNKVIGLNLYDVPNKESAIARRLCEAAGVRYLGFGRDQDYYPRWIPEGVRYSGAMWSQEDNHFLGTRKTVGDLQARTVMTACTTDWLFKGYGLEKTYVRLLGRNLPLLRFLNDRVNGFLPNRPRPVPDELARPVGDRLMVWFSGTPEHLKRDGDWLAVEDRRVRPACYTVSVSGPVMYRLFPYDTFLADRRVADCYSRCRAAWKLNSDVWARATRRICSRGPEIEDANFGWRIGSSVPEKLLAFGRGWIGRRLRPSKLPNHGLATEGSWPNLRWYLSHSPTLKELWESTSRETRVMLTTAWGSDPWARPLESWSNTPNGFFRLQTLATYLDQATRRMHPSATVGDRTQSQ